MVIQQELPAFDSAAAGSTASVNIDIFSRMLHGIAIQCLLSSGTAVATSSIEYIIVKTDTKQKILIYPAEQRLFDGILNSTGDTLPTDYVFIPLTRLGIPWSKWGTRDIGQLQIQVKLKSAVEALFTKLRGFTIYSPTNTPQNRGDAFVQTILPQPTPIAGWNRINDLPYQDIIALTHLLLNADAITQVKVKIGDEERYNMTRNDAKAVLAINPLYKLPSSCPFFPVCLDVMGDPGEYMPIIQNGVRRNVVVEYFWDTTVTATPVSFNILAVGIEQGTPQPVATAKA